MIFLKGSAQKSRLFFGSVTLHPARLWRSRFAGKLGVTARHILRVRQFLYLSAQQKLHAPTKNNLNNQITQEEEKEEEKEEEEEEEEEENSLR